MNFNNIYILLLSLSQLLGDYSTYTYIKTNENNKYLLLSLIGYIGVIYFSIKSLQTFKMVYVIGMWNGLSILLSTLVSYFILNEETPRAQYAGLFIICVGMLIIYLY